jgi:hypothetical protein
VHETDERTERRESSTEVVSRRVWPIIHATTITLLKGSVLDVPRAMIHALELPPVSRDSTILVAT